MKSLRFVLAAACLTWAGCGQPEPTADPAPFRAAVTQYLERNDMALRLKEIKHGPVVSGSAAVMTASMTHADLGGPSVEWEFRFEQEPSGTWRVTSHQD